MSDSDLNKEEDGKSIEAKTETDKELFYNEDERNKLNDYKNLLNRKTFDNEKQEAQKSFLIKEIDGKLNLTQIEFKEYAGKTQTITNKPEAYKKEQITKIESDLQDLGVLEKPKTTLGKLSDLADKVPIVQDVVQMFRPISSLGKIAFGKKEEGIAELKNSAERLGKRAYHLVASPIVSAAAAMSGVGFKIASMLPIGSKNKEKLNQLATGSFALAGKEGKEFAIAAAKTAGLAAVAFAAATPFGAGAIAVAGAGAAIGVATGAISTVAATGAAIGGAVVGTGSMVGSTVVGAGLAAAKGTVAGAATVASVSQTAANVAAGANTAEIIASSVIGIGATSIATGVVANSTPKTNNPATRAKSNAMSK
jgi:hypothetical protein